MSFNNRRNSRKRPPEETGNGPATRRPYEGQGVVNLVEYQKHNPERVNVHIEGEYAFSLAATLAAERKLKPGLRLSQTDIAELLAADLYNKGLSAALQLLALRPRSEAEVRQRLRKRYPDAAPETVGRVVDRLRELGYLNDATFARFWVENRLAFAPRGRNLLKQELMQKGVPRDVIDSVIQAHLEALQAEAEQEDGQAEAADIEASQALELARKKARSLSGDDWPAFYRKVGGFLQRRGYTYEITARVSKQLWQEVNGGAADELDAT